MLETLQKNENTLVPFFHIASSSDERAKLLHRLLLDLSKDESEKELRSAVHQTADFFREKFFGLKNRYFSTLLSRYFFRPIRCFSTFLIQLKSFLKKGENSILFNRLSQLKFSFDSTKKSTEVMKNFRYFF